MDTDTFMKPLGKAVDNIWLTFINLVPNISHSKNTTPLKATKFEETRLS